MFWWISAVFATLIVTSDNGVDVNSRAQTNGGEEEGEVTQSAWDKASEKEKSITQNPPQNTLQLNGTDCESVIPYCNNCLSETAGTEYCKDCHKDELEGESLEEACEDCGDHAEDQTGYSLERNASDWKCLDCKLGYAVNNNQTQCIACKEAFEKCLECSNQGGEIVCSLCEKGFYLDNGHDGSTETPCKACDAAIENCHSCQFEGGLVCTECHLGFYFDYYRTCAACNETIPRCTNCRSFEACQIFGPVQNLTCHDCEDNYYVGEDEASCKIDCRNISSLCENCTLDEDQECLSCSTGAYRDDYGNCQHCKDVNHGCLECTGEGQPSCVSCQEGFVSNPSNNNCKDCSKHCKSCQFAERNQGEKEVICEECDVGFVLFESTGDCVAGSEETQHCRRWHGDGICTACVAGFVLTGGQCEVRVCGVPPPPPVRGGYAFTGIQYGDTVTYDCECGYDLVGEQVLTCDETGQWGQAPCCMKKVLDLPQTALVVEIYFPGENLEVRLGKLESLGDSINVVMLQMNKNNLTEIPPFSEYRQLDTVDRVELRYNHIRSFMWEDFPAPIENIYLMGNEIRVLPEVRPYSFCRNVKYLELTNNKLVSIRNEQIPRTMEILYLGGNDLVGISGLSHCNNLVRIFADYNAVIEIPSQLATSLDILRFIDNKLTALVNLTHLDKLEVLQLDGNDIASLRTDFLPSSLTGLFLDGNRITEVGDLRHLGKLIRLDLKNNRLTTIPLLLPPSLTMLDLQGNLIRDWSNLTLLENYTNLEGLFLDGNRITEVGDLRHLGKLIRLDLKNNRLTTIPLLLPPSLRMLDLRGNLIRDWSNLTLLENTPTLKYGNFHPKIRSLKVWSFGLKILMRYFRVTLLNLSVAQRLNLLVPIN